MSEELQLGLGIFPKLDVISFYGLKKKSICVEESKHIKPLVPLPHRLNSLLGPTQVWKVFKKQAAALEFSKKSRNGCMTFAFQQSDGARLFLVAHPQVFWHFDVQKRYEQRCAFEVIPESTACKLYFDIEFEYEHNKDKDGPTIVDTFITVVIFFLSTLLNIQIGKECVLNLDSTTDKKFSRHLIFQLGCNVFSDNKSVGSFVSFILCKLNFYIDGYTRPSTDKDEPSSNVLNQIDCACCLTPELQSSGCIKHTGLSLNALKDLFVIDRKGHKRIICDLSVYSRNRHFRLFQNTKWGKNSPLLISNDNSYLPPVSTKPDFDIFSETIFLDSLITFFRKNTNNSQSMKVIDWPNCLKSNVNSVDITGHKIDLSAELYLLSLPQQSSLKIDNTIPTSESPYPLVDKFINLLVFPGHIWRSTFFNSTSVIVYDIIGNRYCHNIKRQHQSNNVKYVVNLNNYTYYQKCHDPECSSFRSESHQLPPEVKFQLEDEVFENTDIDEVLEKAEISENNDSDSELLEVTSVLEDISAITSDDEN